MLTHLMQMSASSGPSAGLEFFEPPLPVGALETMGGGCVTGATESRANCDFKPCAGRIDVHLPQDHREPHTDESYNARSDMVERVPPLIEGLSRYVASESDANVLALKRRVRTPWRRA